MQTRNSADFIEAARTAHQTSISTAAAALVWYIDVTRRERETASAVASDNDINVIIHEQSSSQQTDRQTDTCVS